MRNARALFIWVSVEFIITASPAAAQTIPELLAEANQSLGRSVEIETGPPPSIDAVIRETDLIVRGTVGVPRTYLSDDQKEVYSDYSIVNPVYLFPPSSGPASAAGDDVVITHIGGKITLGEHSFTMHHSELPPLSPGIECLFLLKREGNRYRIAGTYYGVFRTDTDVFTPLARAHGFARAYRSMRPDDGISKIVTKALTRPNRP